MTDSTQNPLENQKASSQFVYDTSVPKQASYFEASDSKPGFGARRSYVNARTALIGLVVAAAVGGAVGASVNLGGSLIGSGTGTVVVNNAAKVNWVTGVAAKIEPSVVTISVSDSTGTAGSGSGVVLTSDGYILTNTHVVTLEGSTANPVIEVKTSNGKVYSATVVGTDPTNDLAVIRINPVTPLLPATFANSDQLNVGDNVVAVGAPLGLDETVTSGIISALNRTIQVANSAAPENSSTGGGGLQFLQGSSSSNQNAINLTVIQTDASINPGNSGGALVNDAGQVIGINVAIASASASSSSGAQSGSIGVGFSIPSNNAHRIAQEIIKSGKATHAMLGAYVEDAMGSSDANGFSVGAKISKLMTGSPAAAAGLQVGDVVTGFDGKTVSSATDLTADVRILAPGTQVTLSVQRGGKQITIQVTLGNADNLNN